MVVFVTNFFAVLGIVFRRLWHNLGLAFSTMLGVVAVLALVVCVPIFSYAVSGQVLEEELASKSASANRRLFSFHLYHLNTTAASILNIDQTQELADYIAAETFALLGVPVERVVVEVQTGSLGLKPITNQGYDNPDTPLENVTLFQLDNFQAKVAIVEGEWPAAVTDPNEPVQVLIPDTMADRMFINIGDRFLIDTIEIVVTGTWKPLNPLDQIWFSEPVGAYKDKIWLPEDTYRARLAAAIRKPVFYASWYVIVDETQLHYQRAPQYVRGLMRLDAKLAGILPGIRNDYTPLEVLQNYEKRAEALTTLLFAVGAPMIVLALLFITLASRIAVQQYEQETATIRGRGTSRTQVMVMNVLESCVLVTISLPLAFGLGWLAARMMGQTLSFLKFTERPPLPLSFDGLNPWWLVATIVLILAARFIPAFEIAKVTIVRMKQEQSRAVKKPIWERLFLDFLLLTLSLYAFSVMRGWSSGGMQPGAEAGGEQFRDPLLFVAPALFAIAACMVMLRFVPLLVRLLAAIVERLPGAWAYLSLQQIARRPQDYSNALLLIMISLSLAIFSASTAKTLDQWLHDSEYYRAGTDLVVKEYAVTGMSMGFGEVTTVTGVAELDVFNSGYTAVDAHTKLPTVENAARVGTYPGNFSFGTGEVKAILMGIDRLEFQQTAFFRDDFAAISFGELMNALGAQYEGVLVPRKTAEDMGLKIGDQIALNAYIGDVNYERDAVVVGFYNYFPSIYPSNTPTLILNLDFLFDNPDAIADYSVWLDLKEGADVTVVKHQIVQLIGSNAAVEEQGNAIDAIRNGQDEPERLGLFGVLTIGFLITGIMPGIGFVLYSYASLRRRFIQLGILQALGLSVRQLVGYLALEQLLLMGLAILFGAVVGLGTSYLYVPFLQVGAAPGAPVPPFWVEIGWLEAAGLSLAFGAILCLTILGTIAYLMRLKVFQAVKLGETL
ncbi:MAG: FtsX-like permease family protein [Chloroflexota bacterium]